MIKKKSKVTIMWSLLMILLTGMIVLANVNDTYSANSSMKEMCEYLQTCTKTADGLFGITDGNGTTYYMDSNGDYVYVTNSSGEVIYGEKPNSSGNNNGSSSNNKPSSNNGSSSNNKPSSNNGSSSNNNNLGNNPQTGTIEIAIAWFAGIFAIACAFMYFRKVEFY